MQQGLPLPQVPGLTLRPLALDDAAAWAGYACLPQVKQHTSSTAETVDDVRAVIERALAATPGLPTRFALLADGGRTLVGTVGFHTVSLANGTAEITYDIAPSHWGQGMATAACRAATAWAFEVLGWHRVQATTLLANLASQRVLDKCGYRREGLVRNFRLVRGQPADDWLHAAIPGDLPPAAGA